MAKLPSTLDGTKHNWDKICQWSLARSAEEPLWADPEEHGNSASNRIVLPFTVKETHIPTPQWNSDWQVWMYSNQESLWLIKMRKLLSVCDYAVDSSGYCRKYENNLIWLVSSPKIRATKNTRAWVSFQESLDEFPIPVFPLSPLKKSSPTLELVLEEESSLIPTFQSCTTDISAEWKRQSNFFV